MLHIENLTAPYEFEDRANLFIENLNNLSQRLTYLLLESENKTVIDLNIGGGASWRLLKTNRQRAEKAFWESHQAEIESANQILVNTSVYGNKQNQVHLLSKKTIEIASYYGGFLYKDSEMIDIGINHPDGDYRFFIYKIFRFK